jgi:hypothetical protein
VIAIISLLSTLCVPEYKLPNQTGVQNQLRVFDDAIYIIGPLELRLINYAEKDPDNNLPWSSNYLKDCYRLGNHSFILHANQ